MRTSASFALTFAAWLSASLAVSAQTEAPAVHRHHRVHHHHHDLAAPPPARTEPVESAPSPIKQMFRPYAEPGEGDNNGLSRDPDDCNKGCIGGNPG